MVIFFYVQRFTMLDIDQDGHVTEDEILSVPVDVVDEAFGRTPPGEVGTGNEFLLVTVC